MNDLEDIRYLDPGNYRTKESLKQSKANDAIQAMENRLIEKNNHGR